MPNSDVRRKACQGKSSENEGRQAWVLLEGSAELIVSGFQLQPPSYLATDPSSACLAWRSACPFSPYPILTSPNAPWHPIYPHRTHPSTSSSPSSQPPPQLIFSSSRHLNHPSVTISSPSPPPSPPYPTLTQTCFLTSSTTHPHPRPPARSNSNVLFLWAFFFRGEPPLLRLPLASGLAAANLPSRRWRAPSAGHRKISQSRVCS